MNRWHTSLPIFPWMGFLLSVGFSCAAAQDIPVGYKAERYAPLWEHNPFTETMVAAPKLRPSAFEKLILTSWLIDSGKQVICVQNTDTNEIQSITAESNQNNLRLLEMHLNANPQFVEAIITDGHDRGTIKFRLGDKNVAAPPVSANTQFVNSNAPFGRQSNSSGTASQNPRPAVNPPNPQAPGSPVGAPPINHRPPHRGTPVYRPGVG